MALSPCPSCCGSLSIFYSRPGLAVRTPPRSWPAAPSSGYLEELLRPSDTASSRLAPAWSYGKSPKEGPSKEERPLALGTQCLGSGCVWGERICTSRELEKSSKGKPESQARSQRHQRIEGWLGCTPEGAPVVEPREGPELRLLSHCPFTRARTGLPSAVQSLEHGAIGPSPDPACRAGAPDFVVKDREGGIGFEVFPKRDMKAGSEFKPLYHPDSVPRTIQFVGNWRGGAQTEEFTCGCPSCHQAERVPLVPRCPA